MSFPLSWKNGIEVLRKQDLRLSWTRLNLRLIVAEELNVLVRPYVI